MNKINTGIRTVNFRTGRIEVTNKEIDYLYLPISMLDKFCLIACERKDNYITFELDGKVITSFKKYESEN